MSKHDNIYSILGKLASLEPQPPKQQNILKQLNESAVVAINPLSLKDRLAQKLAETKEVDEDMLTPKQKKMDKNDNGKIDANDLAALRAGKTKEKEGNEFSGELDAARDAGKKEFKVGDKTYPVKEAGGERTMSRAAKGYEKYGKKGMEALAKAGREGKALDPIRAKYDKYNESVDTDSKEKCPPMSHIKKMCKDGMSVTEICKMHPDCDQKELKQMVADCKKQLDEGEYQDGPNKSEVPAFQRKAKAAPGDDSWKTSQQDLDDEASKSPTGAAGLAKAKARLGMNEQDAELYDENNAHSSLPGTRRVSDKEHSEYDAAAHTVRKWMRKRGWDPKSEFKPAMKYIIDNLEATHDDTLTDDVKMAACTCRKHHDGIVVDEGWDDMMKSVKDRSEQGTGKFDVQKTSTGTRYTRKPETFDSGETDGEEKSASDGPKKKGRPAKAKAPERTTAKAYKHKGTRVSEAINLETYVDDTMAEIAALFIVEKAKGKKPDFLDMDKDGDKKESMKKAVGDKKKNPFANKKEVTEARQRLVENSLQAIVRRFGKEVREFAEGGDFDQDLFEALYDYYFDDMPYGVKKARDGDPYEWVADHFHDAIQSGDVEINETKVGHKDLDELAALAGIGGRQQMESSCNMTAEGQMCPEHGMVECGGMMYEGEEKPDFLDVDSDDDKEESFKKAVNDKEGDSDDKEDLEEQCGTPPMGGMMGGEAESGMSINTSMDTKTGRKTVTVTADGEAAEELASMLRMAGMGGNRPEPEQKHIDVVIGQAGGSEEVDEEYANEPNIQNASTRAIMQQGNDLNKPKSMYKHNYRGGDNPMSMKEDKLFKLYDAMKSR